MADPKHPLIEKAVQCVGRQADLAQRMGVAQQTVSKLLRGEIRCSAEQAIAIDLATDGVVSAAALRPDLWRAPEDVPAASVREKASYACMARTAPRARAREEGAA